MPNDFVDTVCSITGAARPGVYVVDFETTTNFEHGPAAHVKGAHIVVGAYKAPQAPAAHQWFDYALWSSTHTPAQPIVLIGHNISFDILHILQECDDTNRAALLGALACGGVLLWDTQDMEYILTAHRSQFATLDDLAVKYGVPGKKDTLKEYLAKGINTDKIPKDELWEYLEQDVNTTHAVAEKQAQVFVASGVTRAQIKLAMKRRAFTTIMMHNGMPFDGLAAGLYLDKLEKEIASLVEEWAKWSEVWAVVPEELELAKGALSSPKKLATMLYGGTVPVKSKEHVGTYKNGKPKYKAVTTNRVLSGIVSAWLKSTPFSGVEYGTDEHGLTQARDAIISVYGTGTSAEELINLVLKYRELSKIARTYVQPLIEMSAVSKTGRIHPSLNTTATGTGRLSSSKPNSQNMPSGSPVKSFFKEVGYTCVEGDYKQLEMVALVLKSGDKQLKQDIENGIDIHYEVGKQVFGWTSPADMTKETRRLVKSVDFGLVYGGGAKTLAAQSGADVATVQRVIDSFFTRYPGVKAYHKRMEALAKSGECTPTGKLHDNGAVQKEFIVRELITFRRYSFLTYEDKYRKGQASFSPTELKNYMVQGLATADFVPFACDLLARAMQAGGWMDLEEDGRSKAMLCNTVHDSIVVWVKDEYALEFASFMKAAMEMAWPAMFKFFQSEDCIDGTAVVAEISMGPSWGETKEVKIV